MISDKCSFRDFLEAVKDRDFPEMIYLTDREATHAQRLTIKAYGPDYLEDTVCGLYSTKLKSFILFLRHGVKPSNIKEHDLETIIPCNQGPYGIMGKPIIK